MEASDCLFLTRINLKVDNIYAVSIDFAAGFLRGPLIDVSAAAREPVVETPLKVFYSHFVGSKAHLVIFAAFFLQVGLASLQIVHNSFAFAVAAVFFLALVAVRESQRNAGLISNDPHRWLLNNRFFFLVVHL